MYHQKANCHTGGKQHYGGCGNKHRAFWGGYWGQMPAWGSTGAVNIAENPTGFEIQVFAPGYQKEDFTLEVSGNVLTVSLKKTDAKTTHEQQWIRREFKQNGFERRFELGDSVDATGISARYAEGILVITLPKKVADAPAQSVKID